MQTSLHWKWRKISAENLLFHYLGFIENHVIPNLYIWNSFKVSHNILSLVYVMDRYTVQFSIQYCQIKELLKFHTVDFPEISTLSNLIYRTKRQASTGIGQHPLGTRFCYQYKCEQHVHVFLQGTPAFHLQNRLQETQVKDTECDLLLTKSIQYFPFTVIRIKFGLWLFFLLFFFYSLHV